MKDGKKQQKKREIYYAKAMKDMGIDISSFPQYIDSEQYGRSFKKVSIEKHAQVAFTTTTI